MTDFSEQYRLYGDEVDAPDTYIDVSIVDYSIDGVVRLEDKDNSNFYDVPQTNLKDWQSKDLLLAHSKMPKENIAMWTVLEDMAWSLDNESLGAATDDIEEMKRKLFKQLVSANRSQA